MDILKFGNEQESEISQRSPQEELGGSKGLYSPIQEAATFITRRVEAAREEQQGQLSRNKIKYAKENQHLIKNQSNAKRTEIP